MAEQGPAVGVGDLFSPGFGNVEKHMAWVVCARDTVARYDATAGAI